MSTTELHDEHDIDWVAAQRPHAITLDEASTLRARATLMEDIGGEGPRHRRGRRRQGMARLAAGTVAAGGIAVAVVLATGGPSVTTTGTGATSHLRLGGGVSAASAAPLVRLSDHLHARAATTAPLAGDATLIVRHQRYPDRGPVDGAHLYTDAGTYYYADTAAGLPAAIAAQKADTNPRDDATWIGRDVKAAESAFDGSIDDARARMANAAFEPGADLTQLAAQAEATRVAKLKASKRKVADNPPIDAKSQLENRIWSNAMDALNAGAGRPAVRAGVLHLLATTDSVKVTKAKDGDRDVLVLAALFPRGDYTERLTIDAATGMPVRFTGGQDGQRPAVTVTYDVSRVTVADIADAG
jgi:hypothetical protein